MLKSKLFRTLGILGAVAALLIAGCSDDDPKGSAPLAKKVLDDTAEAIAQQFVDQVFDSTQKELANLPEPEIVEDPEVDFNEVNDIIVHDSLLYAAYDEGLVVHDFAADENILIDNGEPIRAFAYYDGKLYVGGKNLFTLSGRDLIPTEANFRGEVTALYSDSFRLLIGTSEGLFSQSPFGSEMLMEDVAVNDLVFDDNGLWVATDGDGLYRWDGNAFKRRYLIRDTTIFDTVYDLDFNHGYLFVAASTGFFVYDGGKWEPWTTAEGIPSDCVKSVNAEDWMVQIGTDKGMMAWFNHDLYPVKKLEETEANVIRRLDKKLIVGTRQGEVLMKSGEFVTTLIEQDEPNDETAPEVFSQADDETPVDQQ